MKSKAIKATKVRASGASQFKKNKTEFPFLVKLCKLSQHDLAWFLSMKLADYGYDDVVVGDGFIYAKGEIPVLLTAHMDTVHEQRIIDYFEILRDGKHIISSPQGIGGDDRCGIYIILHIIQEFKCSVLFCEDEEIGAVGSSKFCKTKIVNELSDLKYIIGLDRAGHTDAVFYECDNPKFTDFIVKNTGFTKELGSFSDISVIAPVCGVAAVNLSCGYYFAHTNCEQIIVEDMLHTIKVVKKLLRCKSEKFEYIEDKEISWGLWEHNSAHYWNSYSPELFELKIWYCSKSGEAVCDFGYGRSLNQAWVNFFRKHPDVDCNDICDFSIL